MTRPNEARIALWAIATQRGLLRYSEAFSVFHETAPRLHGEHVIGQLALRCTSTSDTILHLAQQEKLWDAEMLSRAVLEGSAKLAFICFAPVEQRDRRLEEFLEDIPNIQLLRRQKRISEFLRSVDDSNDPRWRPFRDLCIPEAQLGLLSQRYPRSLQRALATKWSIPGMFRELLRSDLAGLLGGIQYHYGFGSQLLHFDSDSVLVMWEREQRSEERRGALELAHAARLFSDVLMFSLLRVTAAYHMKGIGTDVLQAIDRELQPLTAEFDAAAMDWARIEYGTDSG